MVYLSLLTSCIEVRNPAGLLVYSVLTQCCMQTAVNDLSRMKLSKAELVRSRQFGAALCL